MPVVIGIAGGTGAGKGVLAHAIAERLPEEIAIIEFDWYYRDQAHLSLDERAAVNYDHPDAEEWELLLEQVQALLRGEAVHAPVYDFSLHTRVARTHRIEPRPLIIVEGIHALLHAPLRSLMRLKVYVECPPSLRLSRRIQRDVEERGRTLGSVLQQYQATVEPMHNQFVEHTKDYADILIKGTQAPVDSAKEVLERLRPAGG